MRRSDPRTITYLLVFLVVYLLITGILVLVLRAMLIDERRAEMRELESRVPVLEEQLRERERQEREIMRELVTVAGAQDFEDAYSRIRAEIGELKERIASVEERATIERQLRLDAERDLDDVYVRVQALELERARLEANLAACEARLATCRSDLAICD